MRCSRGRGLVPGHEFIDSGLFVNLRDGGLGCCQPDLWVDGIQFVGFGRRRDHCPALCRDIVICEEGIFTVEGNGSDATFDHVVVDFDATIVEKQHQADPVFGDIFEGLAYRRFGRDADGYRSAPGDTGEGDRHICSHSHAPPSAQWTCRRRSTVRVPGV